MKILIIKLSSLGDVIHAIPAVNAVAEIYPQAQIDWLIYKNFSEIIQSQSSITNIHTLNDKKLSTLFAMIKKLRQEKYDLVIDLQGLIKTAFIARSISNNVIGSKQPREKFAAIFYRNKVAVGDVMDDSIHVIERNLAIIASLRSDSDRHCERSEAISQINYGELTKAKIKNANPKICLIPCTTWESKHWLANNWAELMHSIKANNSTAEIYLLGTLKDLIKIEEIICQVKVPFHLVVNKTLKELPDFFSEMDVVVGVDTGPLHIAAAALYGSNAQIIGLYGPTSGARTGPYGFQYISAKTEVSHKRKGDNSMSLIKAADVFDI